MSSGARRWKDAGTFGEGLNGAVGDRAARSRAGTEPRGARKAGGQTVRTGGLDEVGAGG